MHVQVTFNIRLLESSISESLEPLPAPATSPQEPASEEQLNEAPLTPVLPQGSSTVAPGLTMAVGS